MDKRVQLRNRDVYRFVSFSMIVCGALEVCAAAPYELESQFEFNFRLCCNTCEKSLSCFLENKTKYCN